MADLPGSIPAAQARPVNDHAPTQAVGNPDLETALEELDKSAEGYRLAKEYYEDERPEAFASARLRRAMADTDADFRLNFAAEPVDFVANRAELSTITADTPEATKALHKAWAANQMQMEFPNVIKRACEFGDSYLIVWPSDDESDDGSGDILGEEDGQEDQAATDDAGPFERVDMYYNSPLSVRVIYDPEKPLRKAFAVKRWRRTDKRTRVDLYYRDRLERYITRADRTPSNVTAADLVPFTEDDHPDADNNGVIRNPYGIIPVFHFRTDRPYGVPEHKRFYGVQDALRKLIVSHMAGVDYQAFHQRYALMDPETDTSEAASIDEDEFTFPTEEGATKNTAGEAESELHAGPGSFWQLRGVREVGQFSEADPDVFIKPASFYLRAGAQLSTTPLHYFDPSGDVPSGESLRASEAPGNKKVGNRTEGFTPPLRESLEFALRLLGFPDATVTIVWKPPATVDDRDGWATAREKQEAGVPAKQTLLEAGYTQEQVDAWFGGDDDDLPWRVELLIKIANALQQLSAAAAVGMFTEQEIRQVVAALLAEADLPTSAEMTGPAFEPTSKRPPTPRPEPEREPAVATAGGVP